ncbi:MAG: hypothetical protein Q9195_006564 [Heterodermia aff. obscurata]
MQVLFFGDQTDLDHKFLEDSLFQTRKSPAVSVFLEGATAILRREIASLAQADRKEIPGFTTIQELTSRYFQAAIPHPAIEAPLTCISQLVHFLCVGAYPISKTNVVGLCIGSLAAAAVSASHSLTDLLPLAVETVGIAFRIGVQVLETARHIEVYSRHSESWSMLFRGVDRLFAHNQLEAFSHDQNLPKATSPYVSAVGPNTVTISGPPSMLERLLVYSSALHKGAGLSLHLHGPYHSAALFETIDCYKIVIGHSSSTLETLKHHHLNLTLRSTHDGKPYAAESALELFTRTVQEIMKETLRWDLVLSSCVSELESSKSYQTSILAFGPAKAASGLRTAFQAKSDSQISFKDASLWISNDRPVYPGFLEGPKGTKLAIVGLAGRFPGGADIEAFWRMLERGQDMHKEVPADRFDVKSHVDPEGKTRNTSHTPYGCFIDDPGHFDPHFFKMSPREAAQTDPMQRLALVTAYEALEMAGFVPHRTASSDLDRVGTFYGQTSDDYREINASQNIDTYFITGGIRLSRGQFLSKTGSCKTFDNFADGYCRGDSIGTVVIKRLDDAVADKDNILGVILGAATNHSANAISITHPHAPTQENLYRKVIAQGGVEALDVDYVEMHGTGTQAGDNAEMQSISNIFAPAKGGRNKDNPLYVGSVKANIGHGEAASGVTALIKSLLMLQKNVIPPHVGIKSLINQSFPDLDKRNIRIATSKAPFVANSDKPRRLLVNNFSAAGGNTALLLEDYSSSNSYCSDPRTTHIVTVSAKSLYSLKENVKRLSAFLIIHPQTSLPDLSYTTTARRLQHNIRVAVTGSNMQQIQEGLQASLRNTPSVALSTPPKLVFAFSGQGSYYTDLGRDLFETSPMFNSKIRHFDMLSQSHGLPSILTLLDQGHRETQVVSTVQIQIYLVCVQMALCHLWSSWGVVPDAVVGHSLGEYAALYAAGVLCSSDVIFLVGHRARMLEEQCGTGTHSMLAIRAQASTIQTILHDSGWELEVACINAPNEVVLGGRLAQIEAANTSLVQRGYKCTRLDVPFAFHSSHVDPILEQFEQLSHSVNFHTPSIPIISPLLGSIIQESGMVTPQYLRDHARNTVNFDSALREAQHRGLIDERSAWLEIGPHPICLGMVKASLKASLLIPSLRKNEDAWRTLANGAKELYNLGTDLNWSEYHRDFSGGLHLLNLPTYAFDTKNYWLDYKNNWSLTKGDLVAGHQESPTPQFSTTTLQRIISEEFLHDRSLVVFESDLSEPLLRGAVVGHLVNDSGLCPSSVYADIALSAAKYIYQRQYPSSPDPGLNVKDMEVSKPLIVPVNKPGVQQLLHITATADFASGQVSIKFSSVDNSSSAKASNACCVVGYEDSAKWPAQWKRNAYLIKSRIKALEAEAAGGIVQRVLRGMAYKLFSALVDYDAKYRGMDEVLLLSSQFEAAAKVNFQADDKDGTFQFSPYWIDSLAHLSGFVLNANDAVNSKSRVYISHGWESLRFLGQFSTKKTYRTYVKMQPEDKSTVMAGDVYVFEDDVIVGLIEGLKFQQVPRTILNNLIPPTSHSASVKKAEASAVPAFSVKTTEIAIPRTSKSTHSKVTSSVKASSGPSIADRVGEIIAAEVGITVDELSRESNFANLGIDSLLSLEILGRIREDLRFELPPTIFVEHETYESLRAYLFQLNAPSQSGLDIPGTTITPAFFSRESPHTTPSRTPSTGSGAPSETDASEISEDHEAKGNIREIIAGEMGLNLEELPLDTPLGSLGMDSLMTLAITGAIREKIGLDIPSELLANDPSVKQLEARLNPPRNSTTVVSSSTRDDDLNNSVALHHPPASSILLQGNTYDSNRKLFLFPDGSGSATSYSSLPTLSDNLAVFGLNSPYLKSPRDWTCGIEGAAQIYIAEIKRRQPSGPYLLGGWSVGGIMAYEAACQLIRGGEKVQKLLLIDAPCPVLFPPLPKSLVRFFDTIGLFGPGKSPAWLLEHFDATVANLSLYNPGAVDVSEAPSSFAIWAREGVCKEPSKANFDLGEEDNKSVGWMLNDRTDVGPNGWDILLGVGKVSGVGMAGNHFTMMREPNVAELGDHIRRALT